MNNNTCNILTNETPSAQSELLQNDTSKQQEINTKSTNETIPHKDINNPHPTQ
ncbi:9631_t:CDS:1, partial [Acaulospora colombiana]